MAVIDSPGEAVPPAPEGSRVTLVAEPPIEESARRMRRVAAASFTGTLIEFYDFQIYGVAAALVFGPVFFPALGPAAGAVAAFATLGVAFAARPIGGIVFGHLGDRLGRKATLVTTLLMMGIATVLVGLMPSADTIGVAAPILLVILRIIQGLAAGGEWAGAALFSVESAPKAKRGFWSMFVTLGGGAALVLANGTLLVAALTMSSADFQAYGWRIPFIGSIILIGIGLWIRLKIDEPSVFKKQLEEHGAATVPLVEAFRSQPRTVLLAIGVPLVQAVLTYVGATYLISYATTTLQLSRPTVLTIGILGGLAWMAGATTGALLSDRFGRRRVMAVAAAIAAVWSLVLFPFIDLGGGLVFGIGMFLTMYFAGLAIGPMAALLSELFLTRHRYAATAFSYNVAIIIGGAIPPIAGAAITATWGSIVFGAFLAMLCAIAFACSLALPETSRYELDRTEAV